MTIHYGILAHNSPAHLEELVKALSPQPVYVHIDAKSDMRDFAAVSGVRFVTRRLAVKWAGWSLVAATLELIKEMMPFIQDNDYVVLLSGDSFPLQTQEATVEFLDASNGAQFINVVRMPSEVVEKPLTRISRFYLEYDQRDQRRHLIARFVNKLSIPRSYKTAFADLNPYCGSQWWALSGAAVKWLSSEIEKRPAFIKFARNTRVPDEYFFQTLIMASPFSHRVQKSLMFADFTDFSGPRPSIITESHVEAINKADNQWVEHQGYGTGPVLFARKFGQQSLSVRSEVQSKLWPIVVKYS